MVRTVLKTLPADKYIVLNNVYFRRKRWSCQIDHLIISPYGIFSIETKNYRGVIEGNYTDKYLQRRVLWMKYKTYSPIYQNYRHLQRLVEAFPLIEAKKNVLHSIVCFMPGGKIRIHGSGAAIICKLTSLRENLLSFDKVVISQADCQAIAEAVRRESRQRQN